MGESLFLFAMVLTNCAGNGEDAIASYAYHSPPYGGGAGGRAYILVILNHLKHVGNLLDAFLQRFLHHLLDEHVEFGLDGEFHLA